MPINPTYLKIRDHYGHIIEITIYCKDTDEEEVCFECIDCGIVLMSKPKIEE